jgi:hypothetical protein
MESIKIEQIYFSKTRKDGAPYIDKRGKPFTIVSVKWEGKKASGIAYEGDEMLSWKIGQTVEVKTERNGDFLNIKIPSRTDKLEKRMDKIEKYLNEQHTVIKSNPYKQLN